MKLLLPKSDFCLKELFDNETIRTHFVSDVLGIPHKDIRSVRLRNTFLQRIHRHQKLGILDVLIELNDNIKINIEIQLVRYKYWDRRQLFYLAKMYTEDLRSGEKYEKLNKCISISILDFNLDDRPEYHNVYRFRDKVGHEFSDVLEVHTIELRKKLIGNGDIENWIRFFNAESEADLKMIQTRNAGILEAIRELKRMSVGEKIRVRYEAHMKAVRDHNAAMDYAHDSGVEEGNENGIRAMVRYGIEDGLSRKTIVARIIQDFNLDEATANQRYELYSK